MFGRHEKGVSELWRAGFIDLDAFFAQVRDWVPEASRILEIGCGEGAGTERLAASYPNSSILAIDIADNIGRLYGGYTESVQFRQVTVQELAVEQSGMFDLIVLCDVLHHIPSSLRMEILAASRALLGPGGSFVFKDWERNATPIHWACHTSDRWLTGDRVEYLTPHEAEALLDRSFAPSSIRGRARIKPWRNNFALLLQPQG
jgi:2-polyprenyl-6-hydroxyphenyl methylase/3-demethylubiquinone-9 3-methyltransferase